MSLRADSSAGGVGVGGGEPLLFISFVSLLFVLLNKRPSPSALCTPLLLLLLLLRLRTLLSTCQQQQQQHAARSTHCVLCVHSCTGPHFFFFKQKLNKNVKKAKEKGKIRTKTTTKNVER